MDKTMQSAREMGLVGCRLCGRVHPIEETKCDYCGSELQSRDTAHLQKVWAWLVAGIIAYIPANLYPMLSTKTFLGEEASTIIGGAMEFINHGDYFVGSVILIASVVIPVGKFIAIIYLALGAQGVIGGDPHTRHKVLAMVEFIGRWSMIDVFVVAILAALVQLGQIANINPGPAALSFCLSVIFTMLSAQNFDPQSIWDLDVTDQKGVRDER